MVFLRSWRLLLFVPFLAALGACGVQLDPTPMPTVTRSPFPPTLTATPTPQPSPTPTASPTASPTSTPFPTQTSSPTPSPTLDPQWQGYSRFILEKGAYGGGPLPVYRSQDKEAVDRDQYEQLLRAIAGWELYRVVESSYRTRYYLEMRRVTVPELRYACRIADLNQSNLWGYVRDLGDHDELQSSSYRGDPWVVDAATHALVSEYADRLRSYVEGNSGILPGFTLPCIVDQYRSYPCETPSEDVDLSLVVYRIGGPGPYFGSWLTDGFSPSHRYFVEDGHLVIQIASQALAQGSGARAGEIKFAAYLATAYEFLATPWDSFIAGRSQVYCAGIIDRTVFYTPCFALDATDAQSEALNYMRKGFVVRPTATP